MKKERPNFLHKKGIERTQLFHFSFQWPWACAKNLGQVHATLAGHNQSLCEVGTSNVSPWERYRPGTIAQTDEQTDGQGYSYIPYPNFVCGGSKNIDVRVAVKYIVFNFLTIWMVSYIHVIVWKSESKNTSNCWISRC